MLNGYVLVGYVLVGYVLNGYVWDMCGVMDMCGVRYVWDMCGVRYANNLLKNPATKRLSGKTSICLFVGEKVCKCHFFTFLAIVKALISTLLTKHH